MPHWRFSLPPPAAPTSPLRLHRSSSPIAVGSPSHRPLMLSCSRAVHRYPSPSITVHRHAVHHRQVAIAPSLSVHHHCNRSPSPSRLRCPSPYITIKEPSHHPSPSMSSRSVHMPSHRTVHHRRGAIHRCQSVYCFQVAVALSIAVHRC